VPIAVGVNLVEETVMVFFKGVFDDHLVNFVVEEEPKGVIFIVYDNILEVCWSETLFERLLHIESFRNICRTKEVHNEKEYEEIGFH
jgi:hypothetical protein